MKVGNGQECCICLCELDSTMNALAALSCGHLFHHECISKVYALGGAHNRPQQACPVCRTPISKPPIKLFLSALTHLSKVDSKSTDSIIDAESEDLVELSAPSEQYASPAHREYELEGLLDNLQHQINELSRENAELSATYEELRADYEEECRLNQQLEESNRRGLEELAQAKQRMRRSEEEMAETRVREHREDRQRSKLHTQLSEMQEERDVSRKEIAMYQLEALQLRNELDKLHSDLLRHVRDDNGMMEEYTSALRGKGKEELVLAVQAALYQSQKDRKRVEQLETSHREACIENERLQRAHKLSSVPLQLNPINDIIDVVDDDDAENDYLKRIGKVQRPVAKRKPLLAGNVPVVRKTTTTSTTGQYVPDGRGGQVKVIYDRSGKMHTL